MLTFFFFWKTCCTFIAGAYVTRRIAALFSRSSGRQAINSEEVATASACPFRGSEDKQQHKAVGQEQTFHCNNTSDNANNGNKYKPIEDNGDGKKSD